MYTYTYILCNLQKIVARILYLFFIKHSSVTINYQLFYLLIIINDLIKSMCLNKFNF